VGFFSFLLTSFPGRLFFKLQEGLEVSITLEVDLLETSIEEMFEEIHSLSNLVIFELFLGFLLRAGRELDITFLSFNDIQQLLGEACSKCFLTRQNLSIFS